MLFYSCKVRLGSVNNEVVKGFETYKIGRGSRDEVEVTGLPAPEIILLRHLHGEDSVVDIVKVGEKRVAASALRDHLKMVYTKVIEHGNREISIVDFLFPATQSFPAYVPDIAPERDEEDEDIAPPAPTRNRRAPTDAAA